MDNSTKEQTPIHILWDNILMLPLYGIIDSAKAHSITESMLEKLVESQAKVIVLDILGVSTVDTAVANHLIKITQATKLMGAECIISGISPSVAQTMVGLGVDLGNVETQASLKEALRKALKICDLQVTSTDK